MPMQNQYNKLILIANLDRGEETFKILIYEQVKKTIFGFLQGSVKAL